MQNPNLDETKNPELDDAPRRPLDDLAEERILMDPDTWDWESAQEAIVDPDAHSVTEVRLSYDELSRIERAANAAGMTVNAYLRYAALRCAPQHASR